MTTLNLQVDAGENDAYERDSGNVSIYGAAIYCSGLSYLYVAFRFAATIPVGATIMSAVLSPYIYVSDDPNCRIYAEDADDPDAFADGIATYSISARTRTTAYVEWVGSNIGTGAFRSSPDITDVIQEISDRPGRDDTFHIVLILKSIDADPAGFGCRTWEYTDHSYAAKMTIEYTAGGGLPIKSTYYAKMRS